MKRLTFALLMTFITSSAFATNEVPHIINFQSVLRDDGGNLIPDGPITLNFKILDANGTQLYQETQNADVVRGAVNVMIGEGDIPGFDTATGGIPLNALNPSDGEKFVQYQIGTNQPIDPISIGSIPYAFIAERAFGVVDESITTTSIRNGTIKAEDLEPGSVQFADIGGLIGNTQLPADVLRLRDLNSHKTEANAHMASTIGVVGPLATTHSNVLEDIIKDMDRILNGLNQSSIDRTAVTNSINTETNARTTADNALGVRIDGVASALTTEASSRAGADSALGSRIDSLSLALSSESSTRSSADSTLTTAIAGRVSKSGDTMSGDLIMNDSTCRTNTGHNCQIDGVDVSALKADVDTIPRRTTVPFTDVTGYIADTQVPQYMRPVAFGMFEYSCNYNCDPIIIDGGATQSICNFSNVTNIVSYGRYNFNTPTVNDSTNTMRITFERDVSPPYIGIGVGLFSTQTGRGYSIRPCSYGFQRDGTDRIFSTQESFSAILYKPN